MISLRSSRVLLRPWRPADRAPFAAINADPRVMEFLGPLCTREESDALTDRIEAHFAKHGYSFWAVELPGEADFIGFVGLVIPRWEAHFTPCVEIGWRLAQPYWGRGIATEAARLSLEYGFGTLGLDEIVALTVPKNVRSRAVMERLGMTRDPKDDFDYPTLKEGNPLRRHVLYRLGRPSA